MTVEQKIKMALSFAGISQAELARRLKTSPANLNLKLKRNTLKKEDLDEIASALGAEFEMNFIFPDGTKI